MPHAAPVDIGKTNIPNPVNDSVMGVETVPKRKNVSSDFSTIDNALKIQNVYLDFVFPYINYIVFSFRLLVALLELIASFTFFSKISVALVFKSTDAE